MINKKEEFEVLNYYDYPRYLPSIEGLGYKINWFKNSKSKIRSI